MTDPQAGGYGTLRTELERAYTVEVPTLTDSASLAGLAALVIVSARDSVSAGEVENVKAWLARGGRLMLLESGMSVSPQMPMAQGRPLAWNPAIAPYGVQIRQDMVYDLRANQIIGVPTNFGQLVRPYPYFIRAQSTKASIVNAEMSEVGLHWTSSIDTTASSTTTVTPLFVTSEAAGLSTGMAMIDPMQNFPTTDLARRLVAVQVTPKDGSSGARLIVVGSAIMSSDDFMRRSPENVLFALNAIDWLAQDEGLIAIRAKDRRPPALVFESDGAKQGVKYLNVLGLPLLLAGYGIVRLARRRRLAATPYQRLVEAA
jgi:ABC-type uncharacterized transport system involved in gliding motility auxiliary subunit